MGPHGARLVQHRALDAAATAVDRQRESHVSVCNRHLVTRQPM
jgi:hypothetical protein